MPSNKNATNIRRVAGNPSRLFDATMAAKDQRYLDSFNDFPSEFSAVCLSNPYGEEDSSAPNQEFKLARICVKPISSKKIYNGSDLENIDQSSPLPGDSLPNLLQPMDAEEFKNLLEFYHTVEYLIATSEDTSATSESLVSFGQILNCKFIKGDPNRGTAGRMIFSVPAGEPIYHEKYRKQLALVTRASAKEPFNSSPATLLGSNPESPSSTGQQEGNVDIPGGNSNINRKDDIYPIENMKAIIKELKAVGFDNQFVHMGVLAVCAKESRIKPIIETRYNKTKISTIKKVFKNNKIHVDDAPFGITKNQRFKNLTDDQITKLRDASPESFFNVLYGGRFENGGYNSGDGDKYRGRGFNQLTWKSNYSKMSKLIDIDILSYPEKMMEVSTAAKALAYFMKDFHTNVWTQQELNSADSAESATKMAADKTGGSRKKEPGRTKALERLPQIKEMFARGDFDE